MIEQLKKVRQHLLTGVSYAIPFIACGGIMIAMAIAVVPMRQAGLAPAGTEVAADASGDGAAQASTGENAPKGGPDFTRSPHAKMVFDIGVAAFALMLPVLAGYIAYAIAGRPGLVPGFVGGYLSGTISAGFLGAIVIGLVAGWLVNGIKKIPIPKSLMPVMPILIIPICSATVIGVLMLLVVGPPIAWLMTELGEWLAYLGTGNAVVLAMILGAMIAFDMGGPVNKAAFFFGAAMIKEGQYAVMGACAAAICTPPLGLGLATLLQRKLWAKEEREAGYAALAMGMIGITEGAIPFAAADPLRVIPSIMFGSMVASTIAMLGGVGDHAPHGGPIVLPVVDNRIMYIIAIIVGTLATAIAINLVKSIGQRATTPDAKEPS